MSFILLTKQLHLISVNRNDYKFVWTWVLDMFAQSNKESNDAIIDAHSISFSFKMLTAVGNGWYFLSAIGTELLINFYDNANRRVLYSNQLKGYSNTLAVWCVQLVASNSLLFLTWLPFMCVVSFLLISTMFKLFFGEHLRVLVIQAGVFDMLLYCNLYPTVEFRTLAFKACNMQTCSV